MRIPGSVSLVLALILAAAPSAFAQASITGTVRDTSGAVLPGVTVDASSPALIEKVRSATTDGNGQYRIVDLRAGQYSVTFSLAGFSTVKREGVALEGSFTATINVDLRVGELTETITVTGESPIVDVQSGLLVLIELGIRVLEQRFGISHADHRLLGVSRRTHRRQKHRHEGEKSHGRILARFLQNRPGS